MDNKSETKQDKGLNGERLGIDQGKTNLRGNIVKEVGRASNKGMNKRQFLRKGINLVVTYDERQHGFIQLVSKVFLDYRWEFYVS